MNPNIGRTIIEILKNRCGEWTDVFLTNGKVLKVFNIAWGYDLGDTYAHVTTNISPPSEGITDINFFKVNEVLRLEDVETGKIVLSLD